MIFGSGFWIADFRSVRTAGNCKSTGRMVRSSFS
jgi:predicted nucleic acid-binding Zn ribbon protein